ncbi:MAG: 3'-5' exonuclease [Verrucomicrobiota bacterium]
MTPRSERKAKTTAASHVPLAGRFVALDFETADYGRDSACALCVVVVENQTVVKTWNTLIRPPRSSFCFTYLHGIAWGDVKNKPSFPELWPEIETLLGGVDFIAAHNASFDRSVLKACCQSASVKEPANSYLCTVKVARTLWNLRPTKLSDVCRHLKIPLKHHDAASDAHACAQILLAAREQGHEYEHLLKKHSLRPS